MSHRALRASRSRIPSRLLATGMLLGILLPASARAGNRAPCFDFSRPVSLALQPPAGPSSPLTDGPALSDAIASGQHPRGGGWATAQARIDLPIGLVLDLLRDHTTLKNPKECDLSYEHETRAGMLDFERVDVTIHPFPLVSIRWQEQWAFAVTKGSAENPVEALVAYQKVSGTEHIRHFCGTIALKASNDGATELEIYEETDATRRAPEAIARGHVGTLRTLRERAQGKRPAPAPNRAVASPAEKDGISRR